MSPLSTKPPALHHSEPWPTALNNGNPTQALRTPLEHVPTTLLTPNPPETSHLATTCVPHPCHITNNTINTCSHIPPTPHTCCPHCHHFTAPISCPTPSGPCTTMFDTSTHLSQLAEDTGLMPAPPSMYLLLQDFLAFRTGCVQPFRALQWWTRQWQWWVPLQVFLPQSFSHSKDRLWHVQWVLAHGQKPSLSPLQTDSTNGWFECMASRASKWSMLIGVMILKRLGWPLMVCMEAVVLNSEAGTDGRGLAHSVQSARHWSVSLWSTSSLLSGASQML